MIYHPIWGPQMVPPKWPSWSITYPSFTKHHEPSLAIVCNHYQLQPLSINQWVNTSISLGWTQGSIELDRPIWLVCYRSPWISRSRSTSPHGPSSCLPWHRRGELRREHRTCGTNASPTQWSGWLMLTIKESLWPCAAGVITMIISPILYMFNHQGTLHKSL